MVAPLPVEGLAVVVLFEPALLAAARALSAALGDVRTTVPVSERGTAFWVASAAVPLVTPTAAGALAAGAGVWAIAADAAKVSAAASEAALSLFMFKSPVDVLPCSGAACLALDK
ncbi:MAG: hypothetical protein EON92_09645 [Burkholderiales bacterium]|nr:MAG: hypothetical protein EON92_09645 [Burkholderiales bacterium]